MGIKTVPQPPYSPDVAPCNFWLFPKAQRLSLWDNWGDERGCDEGHWHTHTGGLPWGLPEVVGTVQQVHCSRRRLLWRGLEFRVCTINKSAHTKKSRNFEYIYIYIYIYIYMCVCVWFFCTILSLSWRIKCYLRWHFLQYYTKLKSCSSNPVYDNIFYSQHRNKKKEI